MTDRPSSDRFKPEMPRIPGVSIPASRRSSAVGPTRRLRLVGGLLLVVVLSIVGANRLLRAKRSGAGQTGPTAQIVVPAPASELGPGVPNATESQPGIATIAELTAPWTSKDFFFKNRLTGESVPALIVRLPSGSSTQPGGYWAFSMQNPYGHCQLEYVTDVNKLSSDYGFRGKHPMVGDPCSRTLFDPLKMTNLPGNVWVRGAIVLGSDFRPPLGIEIEIHGKDILATRME